ncbi:MAG: hypothetical protein ACKPKO_12320, partial [Candidatus Fonsibacter sp.]
MGVDNKGAVSILDKVLQGWDNRRRRPWALQPDGDVWGFIHGVIGQRGPHASRITKVKGHATADIVQNGSARAR